MCAFSSVSGRLDGPCPFSKDFFHADLANLLYIHVSSLVQDAVFDVKSASVAWDQRCTHGSSMLAHCGLELVVLIAQLQEKFRKTRTW